MSCTAIWITVIVSTVSGAADEATISEGKKLQGKWLIVSAQEGVTKLPPEILKSFRMTIAGNAFKCSNDFISYDGTFTLLDVKGKQRKTDVTYTSPFHLKGKTVPQLARWIDDDTFELCVPEINPGKDFTRPSEFTATKENGQSLIIFRRTQK